MTVTANRPRDFAGLFILSLEKLAAAGEAEAACRLAGEACALLRTTDEKTTRRFNALLHRLVRALPAAPANEPYES